MPAHRHTRCEYRASRRLAPGRGVAHLLQLSHTRVVLAPQRLDDFRVLRLNLRHQPRVGRGRRRFLLRHVLLPRLLALLQLLLESLQPSFPGVFGRVHRLLPGFILVFARLLHNGRGGPGRGGGQLCGLARPPTTRAAGAGVAVLPLP